MSKTAKQRELLVALRAKLIGTKHTLPFTIYSDETIEDLLKAQPATLEELTKVKGFRRMESVLLALVSALLKSLHPQMRFLISQ